MLCFKYIAKLRKIFVTLARIDIKVFAYHWTNLGILLAFILQSKNTAVFFLCWQNIFEI